MSAPLTVFYVIDKLARAGTQQHLAQGVLGLDRGRYRPVSAPSSRKGRWRLR